MTKHLVILSPHLDDAILSCSDHIKIWLEAGCRIEIHTIFTKFGSDNLSEDATQCLSELGFTSTEQYQQQRLNEDSMAVRALGITKMKYLNFIDGGFRSNDGYSTYTNFNELFTGKYASSDNTILYQLANVFKKYSDKSIYIVPIGIGKHVDHILTRIAAEKIFKRNKIIYYAEAPYLLYKMNWLNSSFFPLILRKISVKKMSENKRSIISLYSSQIPRLFTDNPISYPEILFFPR